MLRRLKVIKQKNKSSQVIMYIQPHIEAGAKAWPQGQSLLYHVPLLAAMNVPKVRCWYIGNVFIKSPLSRLLTKWAAYIPQRRACRHQTKGWWNRTASCKYYRLTVHDQWYLYSWLISFPISTVILQNDSVRKHTFQDLDCYPDLPNAIGLAGLLPKLMNCILTWYWP